MHLCLSTTQAREYHDCRNVIACEKLQFQNVYRPHVNENPVCSNSSGLQSVFEKLRFRDGLVWTKGLTGEIELRFQVPPTQCGLDLNFTSSHWIQ